MYSSIRILDCTSVNNELIDMETVRYVHRTVKRLLAKLGHSHLDHEDIAQDILIALYKQDHRYDPAKSEKKTFIYRFVYNKVLDIIRYAKTKRQYNGQDVTSLNERVYDENGNISELGKLLTDDRLNSSVDICESLQTLIDRLPQHLRPVCEHLMTAPRQNIFSESGITRHAFYKILKELRKEFRDQILFLKNTP